MSRIKIIFFTILTLLAVYSLYRTYSDVRTKAKKIDDLALVVKELKEDNKTVKQEIARKKTRDFIEFEAVNKLGLAKKNQEVIVIPENTTDQDEVKLDIKNKIATTPFEEWKLLFFKNNLLKTEL